MVDMDRSSPVELHVVSSRIAEREVLGQKLEMQVEMRQRRRLVQAEAPFIRI